MCLSARTGVEDPILLKCNRCGARSGYADPITRAFSAAFAQLSLGAVPTSPLAFDGIKWADFRAADCKTEGDWMRYWTRVGLLQYKSQSHSALHHDSCFKKGLVCRYKCPHIPCEEPSFKPGTFLCVAEPPFTRDLRESVRVLYVEFGVLAPERRKIRAINILDKRRDPFSFITTSNNPIAAITRANNNIRYVRDHHMSVYLGMYLTKSKRVSTDATADSIAAIMKYQSRRAVKRMTDAKDIPAGVRAEQCAASDVKEIIVNTKFKDGLGMMQCAVRGRTAGEAVGAQMAAYLILGGRVFQFSHDFAPMPLAQAYDYLQGNTIRAVVGRKGGVFSSFMDYAFRPDELNSMCWYEYLSHYRLAKKPKQRKSDNKNDANDGTYCDAYDKRMYPR